MDILRNSVVAVDGDTPGSSPPPSRLWSSVPGSTAPSSPGPFPASSSPSEGGEEDVEMDAVHVPCVCRVPLPPAELRQAPGAHPSSSAISAYGEDEPASPSRRPCATRAWTRSAGTRPPPPPSFKPASQATQRWAARTPRRRKASSPQKGGSEVVMHSSPSSVIIFSCMWACKGYDSGTLKGVLVSTRWVWYRNFISR
ncbi:hypothetical protein C8F04DRAFT_1368744 [Mycena alexandri]|uniref:Uncharacterized protein n=1 Tax=Mycena alexandri TaxID=1745969 RepID=A0AAD6SMW0_9AGAR|nr:hypothetical protein C8F04DRAFT_1368744 [Mycena alexandri]